MMNPIQLSREEAIEWASKVIEKSRGLELPGVFNHQVISQLFWEQSSKWERFARYHIDCVADNCQAFVNQVLDEVAAPEVKMRLLAHTVDGALKDARQKAMIELAKIVGDLKRQPITYNHYFTDTVQKMHHSKIKHAMTRAIDESTKQVGPMHAGFGVPTSDMHKVVDPELLSMNMTAHVEQDMTKYAADQALDTQTAYYKDELKYLLMSSRNKLLSAT
jgi:hypothetical protein